MLRGKAPPYPPLGKGFARGCFRQELRRIRDYSGYRMTECGSHEGTPSQGCRLAHDALYKASISHARERNKPEPLPA